MSELRAVIFDVDGTLAETERDGHRPAFNRAFRDFGLPYHWGVDDYGPLLATTGGERRLRQYLLQQRHEGEVDDLARRLHRAKTAHFVEWVATGELVARAGTAELIRDLLASGIHVAIATTGSRAWVEPFLARLFPEVPFAAVVTGEDVRALKPEPDAYQEALRLLGLRAPAAIAVEDSPPGVAAALAAGLRCVAVTSAYTADLDFPAAPTWRLEDYSTIRAVCPDLPTGSRAPARSAPPA